MTCLCRVSIVLSHNSIGLSSETSNLVLVDTIILTAGTEGRRAERACYWLHCLSGVSSAAALSGVSALYFNCFPLCAAAMIGYSMGL